MSTLKTHNLQSADSGSVNIALTANAGMIVTGISTFNDRINIGSLGVTTNFTVAGISTFSGQLNVGSNIKLGTAGIVTAVQFSGNITGVAATFSGDVSIGGTLTYEDVKNVDSIGIITARSGIKVLAGGINAVGVVTATQFKGDGSQLTGIISGITIQEEGSSLSTLATTLNFVGSNITASGSGASKTITVIAGAGGTFAANSVGVHTTKIVGINTTTIAGSATSEGALQVRGNISIQEGLLTLDSNIHTSVSIGTGKNALLIGPTTVAAGATIDVATGSTLVVV